MSAQWHTAIHHYVHDADGCGDGDAAMVVDVDRPTAQAQPRPGPGVGHCLRIAGQVLSVCLAMTLIGSASRLTDRFPAAENGQ